MVMLSNDNRRTEMAASLNTADLIEAVAICAVLYTMWRERNEAISRQDRPCHLMHAAGDKYVEIDGYLPEPLASLNGQVMPFSRLAALCRGIDRPVTPILKALWFGGVDVDGEDLPVSVGDYADAIFEYAQIEREERGLDAA